MTPRVGHFGRDGFAAITEQVFRSDTVPPVVTIGACSRELTHSSAATC